MNLKNQIIEDGNFAASDIAYRLTDISASYPITPSTKMAELYEEWSAKGRKNVWGQVPEMIQMQSEAGAIGAVHGALQTGSLATTFTSSQGLLLMIPNMYKIAGELTPCTIHVAARAVATSALSIFGDHSDVMATRQTGFSLVSSHSVQQAHDFALISHLTSLLSNIPNIHFFDGFRTSHEQSKFELITDAQILQIMDKLNIQKAIDSFKARRLDPKNPHVTGTAQDPDIVFQVREASNKDYEKVPEIFDEVCSEVAKVIGRNYNSVEYVGSDKPYAVFVAMGSACETIEELIEDENVCNVGLIKIHLYRPFPKAKILNLIKNRFELIPETKFIVLDRCKEPGSTGEPLYLDFAETVKELPNKVFHGRYGLASKEFNITDVWDILNDDETESLDEEFTVGIVDDVTNLSITKHNRYLNYFVGTSAIFNGTGGDGVVSAVKNIAKVAGETTDKYIQSYALYDSKKSGGYTESHLRVSDKPIKSEYLINKADFVFCMSVNSLTERIVEQVKQGGTLLINYTKDADSFNKEVAQSLRYLMKANGIKVKLLNAQKGAQELGLGNRVNTFVTAAYFVCNADTLNIKFEDIAQKIKDKIVSFYKIKDVEIQEKNFKSIDMTPELITDITDQVNSEGYNVVAEDDFANKYPVQCKIKNREGNSLTVSELEQFKTGQFDTGTSKYEKRNIANQVAQVNIDTCAQCGRCSFYCPHAAIRTQLVEPSMDKITRPQKINPTAPEQFTINVSCKDCTGCGICAEVCPTKSITIVENNDKVVDGSEVFDLIPAKTDKTNNMMEIERQPHYFEFSGACAGCGETPYLKLLGHLFGDKLVIANTTGCSSIYGGNMPTTPWCKDAEGHGPAWSNSLFEDNAEYGVGMRISYDHKLATGEIKDDVSVWIVGGDGWAYDIGYGGVDHVLHSGKKVRLLVLDNEGYSNTGGQASKATPLGGIRKLASTGKKTPKKNLFEISKACGHVFVARVSIWANPMETIRAFKEADEFNGPAIIIADAPCVLHNKNPRDLMKNQQQLYFVDKTRSVDIYNPDKENGNN